MSQTRDAALVDDLLGHPTETEWLEFKRNRCEPRQLGEYLSALQGKITKKYRFQ